MLIQVKIKGVALDPLTNVPIVLLKKMEDEQTFPIWIGFFEANAIVAQIENLVPPRPMTHDLIKDILKNLEAKVNRVVITDLRDNTFYAVIEIDHDGKAISVDSRPSDAIALALRVDAPFFVEEEVFKKAKKIDLSQDATQEHKWKQWLEKSSPEDFGKYEM
ncbi:MAG: bifunctional nuclease family protein [Candidatus Schekmanbacteria bacterium]|nr:bifunctional nuclease family protein [Candidatus Schekmanbacteria bacterium]